MGPRMSSTTASRPRSCPSLLARAARATRSGTFRARAAAIAGLIAIAIGAAGCACAERPAPPATAAEVAPAAAASAPRAPAPTPAPVGSRCAETLLEESDALHRASERGDQAGFDASLQCLRERDARALARARLDLPIAVWLHRTFRGLVHDEIHENIHATSSAYRAAVTFQDRYVLVVSLHVAVDAGARFVVPTDQPSIRLQEIASVTAVDPPRDERLSIGIARDIELDEGRLYASQGHLAPLLGDAPVLGRPIPRFDEAWRSAAGLSAR